MTRTAITQLALTALAIFVAILVIGALFNALINLIQCAIFAALAAVGAAVVLRLLSARAIPPASQSIIDQPPERGLAPDSPQRVAKQLEERRKRLKRGE